ncbi:hypothetical protein [Elizabethkingia phage TCUEAP1]|nr:hypothetical protein [Elizabethkingia phage TCUEAP1]
MNELSNRFYDGVIFVLRSSYGDILSNIGLSILATAYVIQLLVVFSLTPPFPRIPEHPFYRNYKHALRDLIPFYWVWVAIGLILKKK